MIVYGALLPHPPLLVPEVGRERLAAVEATRRGVRQVCQNLVLSRPDCLLLITPHGATSARGVTSLVGPGCEGSLARFGAPQVRLRVEIEQGLAARLAPGALVELARGELDHGSLVPLYYLREAGLRSPVILLGAGGPSVEAHHELGLALAEVLQSHSGRVAVVASGDLSHRLSETGPYGFDPLGPVFDEQVVRALEGEPDRSALLGLDPELVRRAGVCGYKPLALLLGLLPPVTSRVFSYEGPLGVGYASVGMQPDPPLESALPALARGAVEAHVRGQQNPAWPHPLPPALARRAGVFVTLYRERTLRGCIGTLRPSRPHLAAEIQAAAVGACSRDPRFGPVAVHELEELTCSVCVLGPLEPAREEQLDPSRYGVVMRSGARSGCLLPGIPGIETVTRQLELVRRKAGIGPREPVSLERFEVERYPAQEL